VIDVLIGSHFEGKMRFGLIQMNIVNELYLFM
jgi:hypothetical protein